MYYKKINLVLLISSVGLLSFHLNGQVKTYPTAGNAVISGLFSLNAESNSIPVVKYMDYHYAHFELSGKAELEVTTSENITSYTISPQSMHITGSVVGNKLVFDLWQVESKHEVPSYLVIQVNNLEKLVILADKPETEVPSVSGEGVYNVIAAPYSADRTGINYAQTAIQQAINDASDAGGGIVYVPYGLYRITDNLSIKSNVHLYLEPGAVLKAIPDKGEYNISSNGTIAPAVIVKNATNAKIYGRGEIDGSGFAIMSPSPGFTEQSKEHPRRRVIELDNSTNVTIDGIIVKDGTGWTVDLTRSDTVTVQSVKVLNHKDIEYKIQNDGINSTSSSNTWINQCFVMTIDDAMCSKARYGDMENCLFSNNVNYTSAAGVKAGMQSVGNMRNIVFRNCDVIHGRRGVGIDTRDGFKPITGVVFNDIRVEELAATSGGSDNWIEFRTTYAPVSDIIVRRVSSLSNSKVSLEGSYDITNVKFEGLVLSGEVVESDDQVNMITGNGINVTYDFTTSFSDNIIADSSYQEASEGWENIGNLFNGNMNDNAFINANEAWVEFDVGEAVNIFKARIYAPGGSNLSSWKIRYRDSSSAVWKDAFTRTSAIREGWNEKTFLVNASKVRFYFTGSGGQLAVNEIQCFRDYVAPAENNDGPVSCLLIEPEDCADMPLFDPFYVASDPDACNGSYITSDIDGDMDTPSETGRVVIDFNVDTAATFYVYLRTLAASGTDDSFWILMDGKPTKFNGIEISPDWIWVQTPGFYELTEGEHRLEIVRRENNTRLDQILITTSTNLPLGCADCPNRYDPGHTSSESVDKSNTTWAEKQLYLFPNPTQSFVNIEFQYPNEGILDIYCPQGSILKSMKIRNDSIIDVNDLQSGYYLCVLKTQGNEYLSSDLLIIGP
jgi:polygalacturonase